MVIHAVLFYFCTLVFHLQFIHDHIKTTRQRLFFYFTDPVLPLLSKRNTVKAFFSRTIFERYLSSIKIITIKSLFNILTRFKHWRFWRVNSMLYRFSAWTMCHFKNNIWIMIHLFAERHFIVLSLVFRLS